MLNIFVDGMSGAVGVALMDILSDRPYRIININDSRDVCARYNAISSADVTVLCLPNDVAEITIHDNHNVDTTIIDASSWSRMDGEWVYGYFDDVYHGAIDVANSKRISNPGCFASGMQSLLRPIKSVLTHYPIVATGISGYTAGGKSAISKQKSHPQPHKMTNITRVHTHANEVRFRSGLPNELIFMPAVGSFAEGQVISIPLARHQLTIPIEYVYQHLVDYYHNNPLVVVLDEAPKSIRPDELIDKDRIRICVAEFENHVVLHAWYSNLNFGAAGSVARIIDKIAEERATNGLHIAR